MKKLIIAVLLLFSSASASAYTLTHVYFKNHSDVAGDAVADRKSTRLNSSHQIIPYAVFCLKK